jgi:hypothetical protein
MTLNGGDGPWPDGAGGAGKGGGGPNSGTGLMEAKCIREDQSTASLPLSIASIVGGRTFL